jgi:hypothetical protein
VSLFHHLASIIIIHQKLMKNKAMSSQQLTPRAPAHIFKVNSFDSQVIEQAHINL